MVDLLTKCVFMQSFGKNNSWTNEMYHYLAWCLFKKVYGTTEWYENEDERIKMLANSSGQILTANQRKVVENRALRLGNEYNEWSLENYEKIYGEDFGDCEYDGDENYFRRATVDFDNDTYLTWTNAVRRRQTVKMVYDSNTSGINERLVDPYKTKSPYGEGYCHFRKEVRQFRFDRIIDIELTDNKFIKPKKR